MHAGDLTLPFPHASSGRFDELHAANQQRVLRTALRLLGRLEDAQDAAQEVFLRLLHHLDSVDGDAQAWLYRVTVNVCHDQFRRRTVLQVLETVPESIDTAPLPEGELLLDERKRLLTAGLATLGDRERAAIVLRDIEGLSTREVAAVLEVEEVTVRTHIASARLKLTKFVRRTPARRSL
jgi:RNA polymerase sigma-70 factor, ECF subfamily